MNISSGSRFFMTFVKVFIILFAILVILPFTVDHIMHFFSWGMTPGNNSIIVFKDMVGEQEIIRRFISILKRMLLFM